MWAVRGLHKSAVEGKLLQTQILLVQTKKQIFSPLLTPELFTSVSSLYSLMLFPNSVLKHPTSEDTVTASFGKFISEVKPQHLSSVVLHRSKRMVLDSIGVGLIGSTTDVFELALQHCQVSREERNH